MLKIDGEYRTRKSFTKYFKLHFLQSILLSLQLKFSEVIKLWYRLNR